MSRGTSGHCHGYGSVPRRHLWAVLSALLAIAFGASGALAAGPPAGMVLEVTGATDPSFPAMSEIPAQTPVALGPGVSVTFILYSRCKLVTVTGGTLTLTGTEFATTGQIVSQQDTECPRQVEVNGPAVATGTVPGVVRFRGAMTPLQMPPNAQIVFSGTRSDQVRSALLYSAGRADQPMIRYDLYFRRAIAPRAAPAVSPGIQYTLRLTLAGERDPLDIPIVGGRAGGATFVVVRIN